MKNLSTRDITLAAMFAALMATVGVLTRFGLAAVVPFSLEPLLVVLAGAILGGRLGALSMTVYMVMGLIGVPVFAKPPFGGPAYVLQPTFGFIPGYIVAAYVTGRIIRGGAGRDIIRYLLATLAGVLVIYLLGLPYLYGILNLGLGKAVSVLTVLKIGFFPFIMADIIKAVAAAFVARAVVVRLPRTNLQK